MVTVLGAFALIAPAVADEMHMTNGSKLIGTLVSAADDTIVFDTPFAGRISVKEANVERIVTDSTVTLVTDDGTVYRDRHIETEQDSLVALADDAEVPTVFAASDIKFVNPEPWRLGEGYHWTGDANAALEAKRGNSDSDEWDLNAFTEWRSLKDRYTFRGNLEYDEADNIKTTDKWQTRFKYDRFSQRNPENYWGGKLRFEYDRFADLDLRTIIGPHVGRQLIDKSWLSLEGEIGPVWVDEQFDEAEDNDYPGALWDINAESDIIGFGTTLYLLHDGTLNFDSPDEPLLNATLGLRMPLILGLQTSFQAKFEYDGGAVDDVDELDETYYFTIGYQW